MCPTPHTKALGESMTGQSAKLMEKDSGPNSRQSDAHAEQSLAAANKETRSALLFCWGWMWPRVLICKGNNIQNTTAARIPYRIMKGCLINDKRDARIAGPDSWCSESKDDTKQLPEHRLHGREQRQNSACRAVAVSKEPCITAAGTVRACSSQTCECQAARRATHGTQHRRFAQTHRHTQARTHTPVRWIIQSGIAPNFYQHNFRMFTITHRRWIPEQLCRLSQVSASRTFRPPHAVVQLYLSHIL